MGKVTIADVAARTGFSKTTISRFLNGKYEFMSEETRKRISEVIKDIEYKPNRMARSLRLQQSHMIGVIVSDISNPFSAILYTGISSIVNNMVLPCCWLMPVTIRIRKTLYSVHDCARCGRSCYKCNRRECFIFERSESYHGAHCVGR